MVMSGLQEESSRFVRPLPGEGCRTGPASSHWVRPEHPWERSLGTDHSAIHASRLGVVPAGGDRGEWGTHELVRAHTRRRGCVPLVPDHESERGARRSDCQARGAIAAAPSRFPWVRRMIASARIAGEASRAAIPAPCVDEGALTEAAHEKRTKTR